MLCELVVLVTNLTGSYIKREINAPRSKPESSGGADDKHCEWLRLDDIDVDLALVKCVVVGLDDTQLIPEEDHAVDDVEYHDKSPNEASSRCYVLLVKSVYRKGSEPCMVYERVGVGVVDRTQISIDEAGVEGQIV